MNQEYFDNNLLSKKRLEKYINKNLYIGGISKINGRPVREIKDNIIIEPNYKAYVRTANYIIVELNENKEIKKYTIYEFVNRKSIIDFEITHPIFSEKDFLNLKKDETDYIINKLLDKKRIGEKILDTTNGYIGTVEVINGKYKKVSHPESLEKIKHLYFLT